jgi:HK97 family phage prohead protease
MPKDREIRAFTVPLEVRAGEDGKAPKVEGYAAVFNEETVIGNYFREMFLPGAFKRAIGEDDVVFLINHDGLPLARTRAGTLTLKEDKRGLKISAELDGDDPDVQRIVPKMNRGDLDKMSIAFWPDVEEWHDEDRDGEKLPLRKIKEARLFDVSIVTMPAYEGTEIGLRSLQQFRADSGGNQASLRKLRMKIKQDLATRQLTAGE